MLRRLVRDPGTGQNVKVPAIGPYKDGHGGYGQKQNEKPVHEVDPKS
jgi:hypothetical protein